MVSKKCAENESCIAAACADAQSGRLNAGRFLAIGCEYHAQKSSIDPVPGKAGSLSARATIEPRLLRPEQGLLLAGTASVEPHIGRN
jgi:hypothetical protein